MQLVVFTEPELGCSYDQLLAVATTVEAGGWHGFFSADHFVSPTQPPHPPGPLDVWTTLAGLARDTGRIRLGTLMTCSTFRLPGVLAVTVAQVDAMSHGRIELGLGAGHFDGEHKAYGIPFPPAGERIDRLEEQLEVLTGMWGTPIGATFNYQGRFYQLEDCPALPKPVQVPRPRIIVGGRGPRRTPQIAARFADEMNFSYHSPAQAKEGIDRITTACLKAGRDPATIDFSVNLLLACGDTKADIDARLSKIEAQMKRAAAYRGLDDILSYCAIGSPDVVVERLEGYRALNISRVYLHFRDPNDLDQLDLVSAEVLPHLGGRVSDPS